MTNKLSLQTILSIAAFLTLTLGANAGPPDKDTNFWKWADRVIPLPQELKVEEVTTTTPNKIHLLAPQKRSLIIRNAAYFLADIAAGKEEDCDVSIRLLLSSDDSNISPKLLERLKKAPNSKQAYAIHSAVESQKLQVTVIGNTPTGLLYGTRTLSQLINLPRAKTLESTIEFPHVQVLDWPDIAERGEWGQPAPIWQSLDWTAQWKLNLISFMAGEYLDANGIPSVANHTEKIAIASALGIRLVLFVPHLEQLTDTSLRLVPHRPALKKYLPTFSTAKHGKRGRGICPTSPVMEQLLTDWLTKIASQIDGYHDRIDVWLSEKPAMATCYCERCGKTEKNQYQLEIELIKKAIDNVRRNNHPDLQCSVFLTNATRELNDTLAENCPFDIGLTYYDGGETYVTDHNPLIKTPGLEKYAKESGRFGIVPQTVGDYHSLFPFTSPQYIKFRMDEFVEKNVQILYLYNLPNRYYFPFGLVAAAEYAWNHDGRSVSDFSRAYATVQGIPNPKRFARWAVDNGEAAWDVAETQFLSRLWRRPEIALNWSDFQKMFKETRLFNDDIRNDLIKKLEQALAQIKHPWNYNNWDQVAESKALLASIKAFGDLKELARLLDTGVAVRQQEESLAQLLDDLDIQARIVRNQVYDWADRTCHEITEERCPYRRITRATTGLLRASDTLRKYTASLGLNDPLPQSRLNVVGEWKSDDFKNNQASLDIDVTKILRNNPGNYHVTFQMTKGSHLVIATQIELIGVDDAAGKKIQSSAPDCGQSDPRVSWGANNMETRLHVPRSINAYHTLLLRVNLRIHSPGQIFPDNFTQKEKFCSGKIGLRRIWTLDDTPPKRTTTTLARISSPAPQTNKKPKRPDELVVGMLPGLGSRALTEELARLARYRSVSSVDLSTPEALSQIDVLIVPQSENPEQFNSIMARLRDWIHKGGGAVFFHDAVGYRAHFPFFNSIGKGRVNRKKRKLRTVPDNVEFSPSYRYDHVVVERGDNTKILVENLDGESVVVSGGFGRGRVVLNGMLTGCGSNESDSAITPQAPAGKEKSILINIIDWLGQCDSRHETSSPLNQPQPLATPSKNENTCANSGNRKSVK